MRRLAASGNNSAALTSAEAARHTGVSTDTLRFYERRGLLPAPARSANGYRRYSADAIQRVRMIQAALDAGFTLSELSRILRTRDEGGAPCREVLSMASAHLDELETRIAALSSLRERLRKTIAQWERTMSSLPRGERARLLEGLASPELPQTRRIERSRGSLRRRRERKIS